MDAWAPIIPARAGSFKKPSLSSSSSTRPARTSISHPSHSLTNRFASVLKPSRPSAAPAGPRIGPFPESVVLRILDFLPVPDVPAIARASRALARLVKDERVWAGRCRYLGVEAEATAAADDATAPGPSMRPSAGHSPPAPRETARPLPQPRASTSADDDFGDFGSGAGAGGADVFEDVDFGDFAAPAHAAGAHGAVPPPRIAPPGAGAGAGAVNLVDLDDVPLPSRHGKRSSGFFALAPVSAPAASAPGPYYTAYKSAHASLAPLCAHLRASPSPSSTLALLFPPDPTTSLAPPLRAQAARLLSLLRFLSPRLQPLRDWGFLRHALLAAADRFDSTCLVAFEVADSKGDADAMKQAAESSWVVWEAGGGRRDEWECGRVWVEKREVFYEGKWDGTENIIKIQTNGVTVRQLDFTPMDAFMTHILESFRLDAETATHVFPPASRVVLSFCDRVAQDVIGEYIQALLSQTRITSPDLLLRATAAAFVQAWKLVDVTLEVLGEDARTDVEAVVYRMFEVNMDEYLEEEVDWARGVLDGICRAWDEQLGTTTKTATAAPTFLTASNPDQVKRNVLAGFRDVLLLPVTIVPRTVTYGVTAISGTAASGLSMLNPQKWASRSVKPGGASDTSSAAATPQIVQDAVAVAEREPEVAAPDPDQLVAVSLQVAQTDTAGSTLAVPVPSATGSGSGSRAPTPAHDNSFDRLQLLVSLDTALELIHGDRESLKRTETFARYPGRYAARVRETIEEIFILLLKAVGDRHIAPGFRIATRQMAAYRPAEHDDDETTSVAPLLQFFELVHIGDTIQSMVQVYFDKELAQYIDKTDFLNAVMREKKRFEGVLDDAVAAGLNAGIEVLMNQVEHIIMVKTGPREYYPEPGAPMELGPTKGCQQAIKCLEMHCNLLRGSTSKEVLEVFYQEVGIRLQAILQRHLKRQIISLEGGFQIIADLNTYHAFVASLRQQRITDDFANLKMLGHVYIVSDAKDLAQIVRDVTRYGGTFTPEDIYEFIQRRSDWKKIEKTVDKAMYALSVKEDCVVM
ncbi:F-box protein: endocytic membrane traffic, recycling ReCYcling 1 [Cryptotrichosporon argae]